MLTEANFISRSSVSQLPFTADDRQKYRSKEAVSSLQPGIIAERGEAFFERALEASKDGGRTRLCENLLAANCTKSVSHTYTYVYDQLLTDADGPEFSFVEIGLGTNNQDVPSMMVPSYTPGSSIRGWRTYFPQAKHVVGLDVDSRVLFEEEGIATHYVDQTDPASIAYCFKTLGLDQDGIDVLLDDGLHTYEGNLGMLLCTWPLMKRHGLYMIEDIAHGIFTSLLNVLAKMSLDADIAGFELPSETKNNNRIIVLQKR